MFAYIIILIVMGFIFAFVTNLIVNGEDMLVRTGIAIVFLSGLLSGGTSAVMQAAWGIQSPGIDLAIHFVFLTLLTRWIGKIPWKFAPLVAAGFAVMITLIVFGLAACLG